MQKIKKLLMAIIPLVLTVAGFIFFEGFILWLAWHFTYVGASLILTAIFIALCLGTIFFYEYGERHLDLNPKKSFGSWLDKKAEKHKLVKKPKEWLDNQVKKTSPWIKNLIKKSLFLGVLICTEGWGPFITTIILKTTTDLSKKKLIIIAVISSSIFSFTWVAFYVGIKYGIKKL